MTYEYRTSEAVIKTQMIAQRSSASLSCLSSLF